MRGREGRKCLKNAEKKVREKISNKLRPVLGKKKIQIQLTNKIFWKTDRFYCAWHGDLFLGILVAMDSYGDNTVFTCSHCTPFTIVDDVDGGNADSQLANIGSKLQKVYTASLCRTIVITSPWYYPRKLLLHEACTVKLNNSAMFM